MTLQLVKTTRHDNDHDHHDWAVDVAQMVFDVWRELHRHGVPAARALSAQRRSIIESWSSSFDVDVLVMAVEGCAASAWCQGANKTGTKFDSIEWIFGGGEARIERLAEIGQRARTVIERKREQLRQSAASAAITEDPSRAEAARARLRALRQELAAIASRGGIR